MVIEACTADDIFLLNEKKEYTLTASCLLDHLLTNKNLTPQAVKLWQILYNEAKFNKRLELNARYKHLAEKMGVSTRSIHRYIKNLRENSFLLITHNFSINGQVENTIIIRVPKKVINEFTNIKNRDKKIITHQREVGKSSENPKSNDNVKCHDSSSNRGKTGHVKIDTPRNDEINRPNNNNVSNNINKNNNNVVDDLYLIKEKRGKIQEGLDKIMHNIDRVKNQWKIESDFKRKKILMESWVKLESDNSVHKAWLDDANAKYEKLFNEQTKIDILSTDKSYIRNRAGQRLVSDFSMQRLEKNLHKIGYYDSQKIKLLNEIIYAIRFGSLVRSNQNNNENSIEKAINIALKLVREKRWQAPEALSSFL